MQAYLKLLQNVLRVWLPGYFCKLYGYFYSFVSVLSLFYHFLAGLYSRYGFGYSRPPLLVSYYQTMHRCSLHLPFEWSLVLWKWSAGTGDLFSFIGFGTSCFFIQTSHLCSLHLFSLCSSGLCHLLILFIGIFICFFSGVTDFFLKGKSFKSFSRMHFLSSLYGVSSIISHTNFLPFDYSIFLGVQLVVPVYSVVLLTFFIGFYGLNLLLLYHESTNVDISSRITSAASLDMSCVQQNSLNCSSQSSKESDSCNCPLSAVSMLNTVQAAPTLYAGLSQLIQYMKLKSVLVDYKPEPRKQSSKTFIAYKANHQQLPILIMPDNSLLVYATMPCYKVIYNYLIAFSEPVNRPRSIHEYKITKFSLYTAMVLEYTAAQIIGILRKLSKNAVFPKSLQEYIQEYMKYAGKVRLQLNGSKYELLTVKDIGMMLGDMVEMMEDVEVRVKKGMHLTELRGQMQQELEEEYDDWTKQIMTRYILKTDYFSVSRRLIGASIPVIQEYDYNHPDTKFKMDYIMKPGIRLRYYQERALKSVIIDQKARSGLIILPCGAGKSLVAILILQKVKTNAIIFCQSEISVQQWKEQLIKWTTIQPTRIVRLSGKTKDRYDKKTPVIFITTYSMVGKTRETKNPVLEATQQINWGVCVADEVHKLPADTFQNVLKKYQFHVKIGLTATPYREDKKIDNLFYMIGPKLFEQNWQDLVSEGCLAKPYCVEIRCKMTQKFADQYRLLNGRELIHTANPVKFRVLQYLLRVHESRGDKILVFCDRPHILEYYAKKLKYALIHGQVSSDQRLKIYKLFKTSNQVNVIFLSRVGDTAIDLPCANVAIQVGMHFKSRRQEVQRMGRIMRAKDNPNNQFNAFFYTLVSLDTKQVMYSSARQRCLIDQGFQYQILLQQDLQYNMQPNKHKYIKQLDQMAYLQDLLINHQQGDIHIEDDTAAVTKKRSLVDSVGMVYRQT